MEYYKNLTQDVQNEIKRELKLNHDFLKDVVLISGNSNKKLANAISEAIDIKLCLCNISKFANTEIKVNICQNIRNVIEKYLNSDIRYNLRLHHSF